MVDSKENYKFEVGVEGLTNELLCCYCLTKHSYVYFRNVVNIQSCWMTFLLIYILNYLKINQVVYIKNMKK